jgi:phosphohistidine phosphatase SixA
MRGGRKPHFPILARRLAHLNVTVIALEPSMTSIVRYALDLSGTRYRALGKSTRMVSLIVAILMSASMILLALRPAQLNDLAEGYQARKANFYLLWDTGELVVLMRHVERCDHSTNPCLAQPDGITMKGQRMANQLGESLQHLGLSGADIYNSPLLRTEQTSAYAFKRTSSGQDWLINCKGSILDDMLKHKQNHHNLILVTHSECMSALEKSLNVPAPLSPDYGASLIVSVNPKDHSAHVLGYIDARDWKKVLARRP